MELEKIKLKKLREMLTAIQTAGGRISKTEFIALCESHKYHVAVQRLKQMEKGGNNPWSKYLTLEDGFVVLSKGGVKFLASFGIEMECGFIQPRGEVASVANCYYLSPEARRKNWGYQGDCTAGTEIVTPICTDIKTTAEDINMVWRAWSQINSASPHFKCDEWHLSMGNHIHIGLPNRRLTSQEKRRVAFRATKFLAFLVGINANDKGEHGGREVRSKRMLTSTFCQSLVPDELTRAQHYYEISESAKGTLEFRIFDTNLPQVTLTCATLLKKATEHELENPTDLNETYERQREAINNYLMNKSNAIIRGLTALDIKSFKREIIDNCGDIDFRELPIAIKEVLYLALKERKAVYDIFPEYNFEFSTKMAHNADKFIDNALEMDIPYTTKTFLTRVKRDCEGINKLSEISTTYKFNTIELADFIIANRTTYGSLLGDYEYDPIKLTAIETILNATEISVAESVALPTEVKTKLIRANPRFEDESIRREFTWAVQRFAQYPRQNQQEVAQQVADLYQEGLNLTRSYMDVLQSNERHYMFSVGNKVLGFVAVRTSTHELIALVIKRGWEDKEEFIRLKLGQQIAGFGIRIPTETATLMNMISGDIICAE